MSRWMNEVMADHIAKVMSDQWRVSAAAFVAEREAMRPLRGEYSLDHLVVSFQGSQSCVTEVQPKSPS